ncbi:hypothetical protein FHX81_3017 [Saccharothrix saharensis]|uniref:Uncharacterized protein n=1 Tax=Saccharothrix saharensis TaxID=571190 RepID=A0A543JCY2_9PSEU|nr:hypothetical protein [Saccharothrix saharensis]TQM80672.1 hypothetical protein FHX81_3017 [Saccharothrix saharensis]
MSTSSLVKRYWCTGETPNMVRRQRGGAVPGPVVPAARTPGQRRFEAALLSAVTRTMAGMRRRGHPLRPTSVVGRVRPDEKVLGLRVHDAALDDLLTQLLPAVAGDRLHGVPGLRVRPRRDHLDLRSPDGEARLLGVTRERWRRAVAAGLPVDLALADRPQPLEAAAADQPTPPTSDLMSGVLRRLPLWRGAAWLDGVVVGDTFELYWRGGPPGGSVAAILAGSTCRVPSCAAIPYRLRNDVHGVALSAAPHTAPHALAPPPEPDWAWNDWLAATAPGPAVDERAVRPLLPVRPDLPDVWEHHEMRTALALRDITTVYRLLTHHGVPRDRIAALTGQPHHDVDRVLSGAKVESYDTLTAIAEGLGVPLGYMGLAHDEPSHPGAGCACAHLDERTKRDRFLAHAALVTVGTTTAGWGCPTEGCRSTRPV